MAPAERTRDKIVALLAIIEKHLSKLPVEEQRQKWAAVEDYVSAALYLIVGIQ